MMQVTPAQLRQIIAASKAALEAYQGTPVRPLVLELGLADPEEYQHQVRAARMRVMVQIQTLEDILAADEDVNWWKGDDRIVEIM